jgi:hypothetical protein
MFVVTNPLCGSISIQWTEVRIHFYCYRNLRYKAEQQMQVRFSS